MRSVYIARFRGQLKEQRKQEPVILSKAQSASGMVSMKYITDFTDDKLLRHLERITNGMVVPTW